MTTPSVRKRFTVVTIVLLLVSGGVLACFLWVDAEQRQYALNRQLIEALVRRDFKQALPLVEAGADPNARVQLLPSPTFMNLLQQLLHRTPQVKNGSPTALMVVCGNGWFPDKWHYKGDWGRMVIAVTGYPVGTQQLQVANAMLKHGANVNARDNAGRTALMEASMQCSPELILVLVEHGAEVDLQDDSGKSAMDYVVDAYPKEDPTRQEVMNILVNAYARQRDAKR